MKKILLGLIILLIASISYSQKQYFDIGATRIKDSTGYTTFNKSVLMNQNLFVKGYITLDTLAKGKIYYSGNQMVFQNGKKGQGFGFIFNDNSAITIDRVNESSSSRLITIDSTGINLEWGTARFKIGGVPISGGGANLYGYAYKDSVNLFLQHNKFKSFTLYGAGSDSINFAIKGSDGSLMVTPVGNMVTFGTTHGTGTKSVYAGAYYIADTNLFAKTNTFTATQNFTSAFISATLKSTSSGDSAIIVKSIKGLTGGTALYLYSPGNGATSLTLYDRNISAYLLTTVDGVAVTYTSNIGMIFSGFTTGRPYIKANAPSVSNVSYGFYSDENTGLLWHAADSVSLVTGGTARETIGTNNVTYSLPVIIGGTTTYFIPPKLTTTQRDALTAVDGMTIFNTTTSKLEIRAGGIWNAAY